MDFKRGQAAMEYLMTYGWAILVIVIVLAALLYLGIFNIAGKTPDTCTFQIGLQCNSYLLSAATDRVRLDMMNGYQKSIVVDSVACSTDGSAAQVAYPSSSPVGAQRNFTFVGVQCFNGAGVAQTFDDGAPFIGKFVVQYHYADETAADARRNTADVKFTAQP
jgi:hypothetical protein